MKLLGFVSLRGKRLRCMENATSWYYYGKNVIIATRKYYLTEKYATWKGLKKNFFG